MSSLTSDNTADDIAGALSMISSDQLSVVEYVNTDAMTFDFTMDRTDHCHASILNAPLDLDATLIAAAETNLQTRTEQTTNELRVDCTTSDGSKVDSVVCPSDEIQRRKDQRRIDRAIRAEANRIRKENRLSMGLVKSTSANSPRSDTMDLLTTKSGRMRKIPSRFIESVEDQRSSSTIGKKRPSKSSVTKKQGGTSAGTPDENAKAAKSSQDQSAGTGVREELPTTDDEVDTTDSDWTSEDDPDRLWCICNKPHDNKFMICCDSCTNWFHGSCVNVTERQGKQLEASGNDWTCKSCLESKSVQVGSSRVVTDPMKSPTRSHQQTDADLNSAERKVAPSAQAIQTPSNKVSPTKMKRRMGKIKSNVDSDAKTLIPHDMCFNCSKHERADSISIYCSLKCLESHLEKMHAYIKLQHHRGQMISVIATEPSTHRMLVGPSAPRVADIDVWLKAHPSFHFVLPTELAKTKSYAPPSLLSATTKQSHTNRKHVPVTPKAVVDQRNSSMDVDSLLAPYKSVHALSNIVRKGVTTAEIEADLVNEANSYTNNHNMSLSRSPNSFYSTHRVTHADKASSKHSSHPLRHPEEGEVHDDSTKKKGILSKERAVRDSVRQGLREVFFKYIDFKDHGDALHDMCKSKLEEYEGDVDALSARLASDVEHALFRLHRKDCHCPKYKSKYRSLVFNLKDRRNLPLLAHVVSGRTTPRQLVAMSADQLASQELQQWRAHEVKNDIEKIKARELEIAANRDVYVVKSHKGEAVVSRGEYADEADVGDTIAQSTSGQDLKSDAKINNPAIHEIQRNEKKRISRSHKQKSNKETSVKAPSKHRQSSSVLVGDASTLSDADAKIDKLKRDEVILQEKLASAERLLSAFKSDVPHFSTEEGFDADQFASTGLDVGYAMSPALAEMNVESTLQFQSPTISSSSNISGTKDDGCQQYSRDNDKRDTDVKWKGLIESGDIPGFEIRAALFEPKHRTTDCIRRRLSMLVDGLFTDLGGSDTNCWKVRVIGRIQLPTVWCYLDELRQHKSRVVSLISLATDSLSEHCKGYASFFEHLQHRNRMAVCAVQNQRESVKDCYITALKAGHEPHPSLIAHLASTLTDVAGQTISGKMFIPDTDILLMIVVRSNRSRSKISSDPRSVDQTLTRPVVSKGYSSIVNSFDNSHNKHVAAPYPPKSNATDRNVPPTDYLPNARPSQSVTDFVKPPPMPMLRDPRLVSN